MVTNKFIDGWLHEAKELLQPDKVVFIDGSDKQRAELTKFAEDEGIIHKLNENMYENSYLYRSNPTDVARVEQRTFICTRTKREVGNTNNWLEKDKAYIMLKDIYRGCMKGRTMYVIPFIMGPYASDSSKCGIQITDSVYVVLSMCIMTRVGDKVLERIGGTNDFVRCWHAVDGCDPEKRYICHFPEDNTIMSVNSEYGGNALLGKKSFALRIASYLGKNEGWMAEHMLTLGVQKPDGEIIYVSAAFPSACGKTNFAMIEPPKQYLDKGYKVWCVSDDISWFKTGEDGRLWAINPENGFFGVVPGTSDKTNKNAMASMKRNTIFTNVVHDVDNNDVWWEGKGVEPPENAIDWQGNKWTKGMGTKGAHPNSRFAAPIENCPNISSEVNSANGVPISAMIFGGRRSEAVPLVYEAFDWPHGVFIGSVMASEATAAASDQAKIRTDPMAMLPFCGYDMGDYFGHWLNMGERLGDKAPKIFNVNWFRKDSEGRFIWPGYSENMRVLMWIIDRCCKVAQAKETPVGYVPIQGGIDTDGLEGISEEDLNYLLTVDREAWKGEVTRIEEYYKFIGETVPEKLTMQLEQMKKRILG